ncbi:MAG: hypothetical protein EB078_02760 [Proteobacteria bacterium]|nr:hypothetical protein [Pseudomonadota bacterium]NDC24833.1 hypothetical protein [Pseudomonadota bacterium]NDD03804.1 hypothetical protein [Pseudomonadota bacterium]NDG26223.1 hypothetical protein [Pseudomonadota bacterium]
MRFKFRLEKIANYFTQKEFAKKIELAKVLRDLAQSKSLKESIERENLGLLKNQSQKSQVGVEWLKLFMDRIDHNIISLEKLKVVIGEQQTVVDLKRKELNILSAKKKALETMRDKKMAEFKVIANRNAQKKLDESFELLKTEKK